ncbi:MAG: hypothetical protein ABIH41_05225 [Nanoarchaeota archaeon]
MVWLESEGSQLAIGILFIVLIFKATQMTFTSRARHPDQREKAFIRRIPAQAPLEGREEEGEAEQERAEHDERQTEGESVADAQSEASMSEGGADSGTLHLLTAETHGEEAQAEESRVEEDTTAIEEHTLALDGCIKAVDDAVIHYAQRREADDQQELKEDQTVEQLADQLADEHDIGKIDAKATEFLKGTLTVIWENMNGGLDVLERDEQEAVQMLAHIEDAVKEIGTIIGRSKTCLKDMGKHEKKEQKLFSQEIHDLQATIRSKEKKLNRLRKSKDVDGTVIANLKQEIALFKKKRSDVARLQETLRRSYAFINQCIARMTAVLEQVSRKDKDMARHEKTVEKRRGELGRRTQALRDALPMLIEHIRAGTETYALAVAFSKDYTSANLKWVSIYRSDLTFDENLQQIMLDNLVMTTQIEAFEDLEASLVRNEDAVRAGMEAMVELLQAVWGEHQQAETVKQIDTLKEARKVLADEGSIAGYVKQIQKELKANSERIKGLVERLIDFDKEKIQKKEEETQKAKAAIGRLTSTMFARKAKVNASTSGLQATFEHDLETASLQAEREFRDAQHLKAA